MALDVGLGDLGQVLQLFEVDGLVGVEKHQYAHLVCAYSKFMATILFSQYSSDISRSKIASPSQQSPRMLISIVFIEVTNTQLDLLRQLNLRNLSLLLPIRRLLLSLIWPVACGQNLNIHLDCELLGELVVSEFVHGLLRHFDIFKHHFKLLSELETALFF